MASEPAAQAVQVGAQRTLGAQLQAHVRGAHVGDHHGDEQRVDALRALLDELLDLALQRLQTADAAGDDRPDPVRLGAGVEVRVGGRLLGRADRVAREEVEAPDLALVDVLLGVEAPDLGGDVHALVAVVEARDLADAGLAGDERAPHLVDVAAEWRHDAEAGDDDSPGCCHRSLNPIRFRCPGRRRRGARSP